MGVPLLAVGLVTTMAMAVASFLMAMVKKTRERELEGKAVSLHSNRAV
jgi:hypothetical protein